MVCFVAPIVAGADGVVILCSSSRELTLRLLAGGAFGARELKERQPLFCTMNEYSPTAFQSPGESGRAGRSATAINLVGGSLCFWSCAAKSRDSSANAPAPSGSAGGGGIAAPA